MLFTEHLLCARHEPGISPSRLLVKGTYPDACPRFANEETGSGHQRGEEEEEEGVSRQPLHQPPGL